MNKNILVLTRKRNKAYYKDIAYKDYETSRNSNYESRATAELHIGKKLRNAVSDATRRAK